MELLRGDTDLEALNVHLNDPQALKEYYKGEAEDMRDTVEVGITVKTKLGTFNDCVKVYDWTPLDPKSREHKYYCPSVGALVLNEHLETGKRSELTKITP